MADSARSPLQFERLVESLLKANGFSVQTSRQDRNFDFLALFGNEIYAIEVKYYRTERPQVSLLESAAARLSIAVAQNPSWKGMLVAACRIDPDLRLALEKKFGLVFVDRTDLFIWAAKVPEIVDELSSLLETGDRPPDVPKDRDLQAVLAAPLKPAAPLAEDNRGTDLCKELRALKRGRKTWAKYEKLCDQILRYLFPNDLYGWHTQKRTDDGLGRFDYVCRLRPSTEFWAFLIAHLDSRYVLFEFKNYTGKIKQGQVLTTEKYLLERGLRRAAVIFSRSGADANAIAMTKGAMREHGKLMLILDDEMVCEMLHMKERGEDPSDLLFDTADDFLLSLSR